MLQSHTLPDDKRDAFLQAFSELPQRILWKWEADMLPGQPKNVWIEKWCPQIDILSKSTAGISVQLCSVQGASMLIQRDILCMQGSFQ